MLRRRSAPSAALLAILAPFAAAPSAPLSAQAAPEWEPVAAPPAWVQDIPPRPGLLRFTTMGRSNLAAIAQRQAAEPTARSLAQELGARLGGLLDPVDVARLVAEVLPRMQRVRGAVWSRAIDPRPVPGNTLSEAWVLWEVPLAALRETRRTEAEAAPATDPGPFAATMQTTPHWVTAAAVEAMESHPVQFALSCQVAMPTPGWQLAVERVEQRDDDETVRVFVTARAPSGAAAQVVTATPLRIPLGPQRPGTLRVELHGRTGDGDFALREVIVAEAR